MRRNWGTYIIESDKFVSVLVGLVGSGRTIGIRACVLPHVSVLHPGVDDRE